MSGVWGNKVKYSIFGESHGGGIGITIDGLKPGMCLDLEKIRKEMKRRAPGSSKLTTPRKEGDEFEILSGYFEGYTTGAPLSILIRNSNTMSKDYSKLKDVMRPGHADFTGKVKYEGFNDYRGGGHFSGRITAPIVFAGAIAKQILEDKEIFIGTHIQKIKNIDDDKFNALDVSKDLISKLNNSYIPLLNGELKEAVEMVVDEARSNCDSVGGILEAAIINLPIGLGEPFFDSMESTLSHLLFSVPAVKGIEFGSGFEFANMFGSQANDEYYIDSNKSVKTYTNNNGGILGGITNGMPLIFRCAIKPTPSISQKQNSVNIETMENEELEIVGRHDPCILFRAVPVIEAVSAMAVLEHLNF
jgi:chorismate synthase